MEGTSNSFNSISILVVDDDATCLSIVAAALKKFKYQVETVSHPTDALCILRIKAGAFDLVVSDVHMPDMNGFELQQAIAQEFNLPVVLMSADDQEGIALKGLESGAAFFILKPVSADDMRDLWQYAAMKKKSTQVVDESGSFPSVGENNISNEIVLSAMSMVNKDSKRKSLNKEGFNEKKGEKSESASHKKPKVVWTNSLHNRFLEAIRTIGLDRAVPKKILEVMNVPGLTRENIASHLQKYRIFLRRVSEASYTIQNCGDQNGFSSNFVTSNCESSLNTFNTQLNFQNPRQFPSLNPNIPSLPNTNLVPQSRLFGQSQLISNRGSWVRPNIGNSNLMTRQDNYQTRPAPLHGHLSDVSALENHSTTMASPSNNFTYPTRLVGYNVANHNHVTNSGDAEKYEGLNLGGGMTNLPNENRVYDVNDQLGQHLETSNPFVANNNGGEQLGNGVSDYRTLQQPNGGNDESDFIPDFDISDFDILDDAGFLTTLADQVNNQNQVQQNGNEIATSSNFYGAVSQWDNLLSSFDQAANQQQSSQGLMNDQGFGAPSYLNETMLQPSYQQQVNEELPSSAEVGTSSQLNTTFPSFTDQQDDDDDDLLESLLAPFGEDQTFGGI